MLKGRTKQENEKDRVLKSRYNIGLEDFEALVKKQKNTCPICHRQFARARTTTVDHDHKTGRVRGLLCQRCNLGLGQFLDSPDLLRSALLYVQKS